ncbi:hypothetical protein F3J44_25995 [Pantoea sp. Tr-811]|uniref:rhamnosyltransferase WsaF family glycosyltransferase n=1 Tax=Pantoea sp. Tr-811 TaxID=2608361 RepID=UPI001424667C|nr:rhamnan synthesis F family protein [Pantoea sp. Tr-811]NIF29805.1 hypothetical protein [Pantoea sp. Tr-811]
MQSKTTPTSLKLGNEATKAQNYIRAIEHYKAALKEQPAMAKFILNSISYAERKAKIATTSSDTSLLTEQPSSETVSRIENVLSLKIEPCPGSTLPTQPKASDIFRRDWYVKTYNYDDDPSIDWLQHYHTTGWKKGEDPSPLFSTSAYLESEAGLMEFFISSNQSPLSHFCAIGFKEKRNLFFNPMISFQQRYQTTQPTIKFASTKTTKTRMNCAVFLHCFYIDIADDTIAQCLNSGLDVYAALIEGTDYSYLIDKYSDSINYKIFPNRGRDIAPFVTGFTEEIKRYEFALHLHTKKSLHYGSARSDWMGYCVESLLGNIDKIDDIFQKHKTAAIIYPEPPDFIKEQMNWGHNFSRAKSLMSMLGHSLEMTDRLDFPAGSMFWFRTKDLIPIFELKVSPYSFEFENGQVDGTLAHAYERIFGMYVLKSNRTLVPIRKSTSQYFDFAEHKRTPVPAIQEIKKSTDSYNLALRHFYPELTPFSLTASPILKPRINLLVPTIDPVHIFGGIATALDFYKRLAIACGFDARIITTDGASSPLFLKKFPTYSCFTLKYCVDEDHLQIVSGVPRSEGDLQIRKNDIFIATSWWSANHLQQICSFQETTFNKCNQHVYLVQDYEPHFYGWSSKSQLADETYRNNWIKVYNTDLLQQYFNLREKSSGNTIILKPELNASIKTELTKLNNTAKENIILVYGRPFAERNCNEILLEAISIWQRNHPESQEWKIVSLGQQYEHILVDEMGIQVLGKVSLEEYAALLAKSKIGISLMVSPHPSYPPFEMLAAGLKTYTNNYDNKLKICDSPNLHMGNGTPEDISNFLIKAVNRASEQSIYDSSTIMDANFGEGLLMTEAIEKTKELLNFRDEAIILA